MSVATEELKKCKFAKIETVNSNALEYYIPMHKAVSMDDITGKCYLLEFEDYIINPPHNFTLHSQWNNNIIPTHKRYNCEVVKLMGKMMYVNGIAIEDGKATTEMWCGWLPQKSVKIIEEL